MSKMPDFTKALQDMMGALPMDAASLQNAFKMQAAFGEKAAKVALQAAEKSAEISSKWTKETLARMASVTSAKAETSDYAKSFNDFATASAESVTANMAAFVEVAKKMQADTIELMLAATQEARESAASAMKPPAADVSVTPRKAKAAR